MSTSPASATVAAVDLGASSGRVMLGRVDRSTLDLREVTRFDNVPVRVGATLHWDALSIFRGVLDGLRAAGPVDSIGVDSWAVDYGLLDADGALLGNPVHYRDSRTDGVMPRALATVPAAEIYATTGLQFLPFNTVFQLIAAHGTAQLAAARRLLLIPDLVGYWLTGEVGAERTNASTTQLLDVTTGSWATGLMQRLGIAPELFPALREPGSTVGELLPNVVDEIGLGRPVPVTAVGSHDTASAVLGIPAENEAFAYISCGTWSLVGVELDAPVLTDASRRANFTNELGVDGTIRYLRNVMGLWLLQESVRTWRGHGVATDLDRLLAAAAAEPPLRYVVDPDDPAFLPPGDMPQRIAQACRATGQPAPASPAAFVRCIVDSLAMAHRRAVRQATHLSGRDVNVVHIVGGGARNALLCQLTADACGLPVVAGPVEATALGNALVQARALGAVAGGRRELRELVRGQVELHHYRPTGLARDWDAAQSRAFDR